MLNIYRPMDLHGAPHVSHMAIAVSDDLVHPGSFLLKVTLTPAGKRAITETVHAPNYLAVSYVIATTCQWLRDLEAEQGTISKKRLAEILDNVCHENRWGRWDPEPF